eukprot:m.72807 g.72807  ORF g.72807 m.72807 type:complete len:81 (-) comp8399_c1_seq1:1457-1699(-)
MIQHFFIPKAGEMFLQLCHHLLLPLKLSTQQNKIKSFQQTTRVRTRTTTTNNNLTNNNNNNQHHHQQQQVTTDGLVKLFM